MIKNINGRNHVIVNNYNAAPYISPGSQSAGMVRYNTNTCDMEVYDGVAWKQLSSSIDIGLDPETEMILTWAREKMLEEKRIDDLCEKHPGLRKAKDNYELFKKLIIEESV